MAGKGEVVNQSGLAAIWGVHRNTVAAWVRKGCPYLTKGSKARGVDWEFDTAAVAKWRIEEAVADTVGDTEHASKDELERRKLAAETTVKEIDAAKARGDVADLEEVERQLTGAAIEVRSRLQQMVARVAPMLLGETDVSEIKRVLGDEVEQALTALADDFGSSDDD